MPHANGNRPEPQEEGPSWGLLGRLAAMLNDEPQHTLAEIEALDLLDDVRVAEYEELAKRARQDDYLLGDKAMLTMGMVAAAYARHLLAATWANQLSDSWGGNRPNPSLEAQLELHVRRNEYKARSYEHKAQAKRWSNAMASLVLERQRELEEG